MSVRAAFPDETKKTCLTEKYSFASLSSLCRYSLFKKNPLKPCNKLFRLIGAAAGGMVRCIFIIQSRPWYRKMGESVYGKFFTIAGPINLVRPTGILCQIFIAI